MAGLLGTPLPLVAAPMAGGATTLALLGAVAAAGAFPFLPAGYRSPEAVAEDLAVLRHEHVGVNVFVPSATPADPDVCRRRAPRRRRPAGVGGFGVPRHD